MEFRPFRVRLATRFRGVTERSGVLIRGRAPDGPTRGASTRRSPTTTPRGPRGGGPRRWRRLEATGPLRVRASRARQQHRPGGRSGGRGAPRRRRRMRRREGEGRRPGSTPADDVARVEAVAAAVAAAGGPSARVRVDANGAWAVDDAVRALAALERAARSGGVDGLEYAEQPCATIDELAALRRRTAVPIAADESVRVPSDPLAVARAGAADVLVLKVVAARGRPRLHGGGEQSRGSPSSCRARWRRRSASRRASRSRLRCPTFRTRAGSEPAPSSRTTSSPTRSCRAVAILEPRTAEVTA